MAKEQHAQAAEELEEDTKMLGAHVDAELYWAFKKAASERKEPLKDAVAHAARMYISAISEQVGG